MTTPPDGSPRRDFTRHELANYLNCSLAAVDDLVANGRVESYRLGDGRRAGRRITWQSVEALRAGRPIAVLRSLNLTSEPTTTPTPNANHGISKEIPSHGR